MRYLKECAIIFGITLAGELLNAVLPLPVPAGVYGLFLLLLCLCTGAVKLADVEATGNFLLDIMPVMFVPAAAGLLDKFGVMKPILLPLIPYLPGIHPDRDGRHRQGDRLDPGSRERAGRSGDEGNEGNEGHGSERSSDEKGRDERRRTFMTFVQESMYLGFVLTLAAYLCGMAVKKKFGWAVLNPLLVGSLLVIGVLLLTGVEYQVYNQSAQYISYLLTPATVCLAIPLYKQLHLLRKHFAAIIAAIAAGVAASAASIFAMCLLFRLDHITYVSILPKSITTAIGMGVSEEAGGMVTITVVGIIITGIFGNIIGETVFRVLKIRHPMSKGLALGTAAHAIGTAKALELGEVEGAMASLSIAVAGLMTVIVVPLVSGLI